MELNKPGDASILSSVTNKFDYSSANVYFSLCRLNLKINAVRCHGECPLKERRKDLQMQKHNYRNCRQRWTMQRKWNVFSTYSIPFEIGKYASDSCCGTGSVWELLCYVGFRKIIWLNQLTTFQFFVILRIRCWRFYETKTNNSRIRTPQFVNFLKMQRLNISIRHLPTN